MSPPGLTMRQDAITTEMSADETDAEDSAEKFSVTTVCQSTEYEHVASYRGKSRGKTYRSDPIDLDSFGLGFTIGLLRTLTTSSLSLLQPKTTSIQNGYRIN